MNLYHYSMVNNIEFGVLFNKDEDEENYNLILNEFSFLKEELQNPIEIITLIKIVEECEIVDVRLVYHQSTNNNYLHLVDAEQKYLSIKIGDKVKLQSIEYEDKLKELINNYAIYTGENINGKWFTFNPYPNR